MNKLLFSVLLLLTPQIAYAEEYVFYGLGIANSAKYSQAETKVIGGGWRDDFPLLGLTQQAEVGYFNDGISSEGRKSGVWGGYSLGLEVANEALVARLMVGPALISSPDAYLGGHFQFNNDACIGVRDKKGNSILLKYKHLSSAGIENPNVGRDFMLFEIAVRIW